MKLKEVFLIHFLLSDVVSLRFKPESPVLFFKLQDVAIHYLKLLNFVIFQQCVYDCVFIKLCAVGIYTVVLL